MSYSRECRPAYALASNEAKPDGFLLRNYSADAKYNDLYTCDHCDTILHVSCFLPARYLRSSKSLSICSYGGSGATECWCELCLQPTRTHSLPLLYPRSPSEMRGNPPVVCLDRRHPVSLSTLGRSFVPWHAGPGMTGQYILHKILDNWPEWFSEEPPGIGLVNVEWDNEENEVQ